jgi:hypothetical protein
MNEDNNMVDNTVENQSESSDDNSVEVQGETCNNDSNALPKRARRPPGYLDDFVTGSEAEQEEQLHNLAIFSSSNDPTTYEEAAKSKIWRKAMDLEMDSIERNNSWELTTLPPGVKTIGVKWIYKTKLNERGEIEKHKARLVAKGYTQKHEIDFNEVFAPVARWGSICPCC